MALLHSFYLSGDVTSETSSFAVAFILWMREEDQTRGKKRKGRDLILVMLLLVGSIQLVEYCTLFVSTVKLSGTLRIYSAQCMSTGPDRRAYRPPRVGVRRAQRQCSAMH
jgi:hypothetical protein